MAAIVGPPTNVIRNRPITTKLRELLDGAADDAGVERVVIVSGGQTSNHSPNLEGVVGGWTGSRRHDNGGAADIELNRNGVTLSFTDTEGSQVANFVTACAARGATGIGAGVHYMGPRRIHVGFGNSPMDVQKLVWGAAGLSKNAPPWLRAAAQEGWNNPTAENLAASAAPAPTSAPSVVTARDGLWLRKGPGLGFDRARLLEEGAELTVVGVDGDWARVDLEGDGRVDGHVFAAFLGVRDFGDAGDPDDGVEEPADYAALAELAEAEGVARGGARRGAGRRRASGPRTEQ